MLPVPGVSRCHALLQVEAGGIDLRDAGSKNGTFLDGRRLGAGPVAPGDLLRFGPVELVVERLAPGDAMLAIPAPQSSPPPVPAPAEDAATAHLAAFDPATLQRWLAALEIALREPRPGATATVGSRLGEIARALGADSAAVFDLAGASGAGARVRGAWGEPGGDGLWSVLETAAGDLRRSGTASEFRPSIEASPGALFLERAPRGAVRGIVFGGRFRAHEESEPLLRMLLRILLPPAGPWDEAEPPRAGHGAADPALRFPSGYLVGHAPAIRSLCQQLAALHRSSAPVLVTGETGTGKEPIARTVHESSRRRAERFVAVNCAAIPGELLEAELFGVAAGAATGVAERPGLFRTAEGGTLFLDEIGELPMPLQGKLLRAVENGEVPRVGGGIEQVDVRIVAATHRDLPERVSRGAFRADLYYRIATHVVRVPPLRERREDIPALVEHLLGRAVAEQEKRIAGLTHAALDGLSAYPWPGNVRELENEVRRLVAVCPDGEIIDSTMLSDTIRAGATPEAAGPDGGTGVDAIPLQERLDVLERRWIVEALVEAAGNRSQAAKRLGIHRNSLAAKLSRLGIDPGRLPGLEG